VTTGGRAPVGSAPRMHDRAARSQSLTTWTAAAAILDAVLDAQLRPPPAPLSAYARALGVRAITTTVHDEGCVDFAGGDAVIALRSGLGDNRRRFTLAHELGHVALYRYETQLGEPVDFDVERLCDQVAARLLLPDRWVLPLTAMSWTLPALETYASQARVSVAALVNRLSDAGSAVSWCRFRASAFAGGNEWRCWERAGAKGVVRGDLIFGRTSRDCLSSASNGTHRERLTFAVSGAHVEVDASFRKRDNDVWMTFARPQGPHAASSASTHPS
jgi:hypothetical protein